MDDKALDVARFLWQQPTRRLPLRARPLPPDVRNVIDLAAGGAERLAEAATKTGDTPAQILDAVRFYVREILLFDGADAYRVLGVAPDATAETIKSNFRALQHWLHPDRIRDDWEVGYAARINTAWGALRSPERRAIYDAELRAAPPVSANVGAGGPVMPRWQETAPEHSHRRNWLGLGLAALAGLALAVLALRQSLAPPPEWPQNAAVSGSDAGPVLESDLGALLGRVGGNAERAPRAPAVDRSAVAAPPKKTVAAPRVAVEPARTPAARLKSADTVLPIAPSRAPPPARAVAVTPAAQPVIPNPPEQRPPPDNSQAEPPAVVSTSNKRPPVASVMPPVPSPEVGTGPTDLVHRAGLVHRRGKELTRYLSGNARRSPPIWQSVAAQDAAANIRTQLAREASANPNGRKSRISDPVWQVSAERATLTSSITREGSAGESERATLRVQLAWQEGMWLVHSIEAENL